MDTQLRYRLLEMPGEYTKQAAKIVAHTAVLSRSRLDAEKIRTRVTAETVATFPEKSNETERKAKIAEALTLNLDLHLLEEDIAEREVAVKCHQLWLDTLRYEFSVLQAVVRGDSATDPGSYANQARGT